MADYATNGKLDAGFDKLSQRARPQRPRWLSLSKPARTLPHPPLGQSLVEFALVAPLLISIVVGIIELGILFSTYVGLANSAREGARAAAIYRYPGLPPQTGATADVQAIDEARQNVMSTAVVSTLNPITPVEAVSMTLAYVPGEPDAANLLRAGDTVSVTLEYTHPILWQLFGQQAVVLRAQSSARIEPGSNQ